MVLLLYNLRLINNTGFLRSKVTIKKCYMHRIAKAVEKSSNNIQRNPILIKNSIKRKVHYHVDDITAMKSSHELAQKNPLLQKQYIKGPLNNSFQHPSIGRITCEKLGCENKLCDNPCDTIKEKVYVGHVTHSAKYGKFISNKDFNNKDSPQYYKPYHPPVKNYDSIGQNTNESRTNNLNQHNTEARTMIHIYSSHNPLDEIFL